MSISRVRDFRLPENARNPFSAALATTVFLSVLASGFAQNSPGGDKIFTGDVSVTPTCTYLGNYSLSPGACSNKVVLSYSNTGDVSIGNDLEDGWFMSAVTILGTPQKTGTILPALDTGSGNLVAVQDEANGAIALRIGSGTSLIPEAADPQEADVFGFCGQVRLKDPSTGLYVSVDDCESPTLSLSEANNSSTIWNVEDLSDYVLIPNHEEDAEVSTSLADSNIVFYSQQPNSTVISENTFPVGLVHVGLDTNNTIISFLCPQLTKSGMTIEVQIGQVGGRMDPTTGAAYIVLDDVSWLIFGPIVGFNETLTKENGLKVVLGNVTGGTRLVLPTASTSDTPENTAITVVVPAITQEPVSNTSWKDLQMIEAASTVFKSTKPGTEVFWALYLEAPEAVMGEEYLNFAANANQGVGPGGIYWSNSTSGQTATSESSPSVSMLLSILFLLMVLCSS